MKIKEIESQTRSIRGFYAVYECEHCGHTERGRGYGVTIAEKHSNEHR